LIDAEFMPQKRNSKWRPPPSWIYFRWLFLTYCRPSTIERNHHTKFHENISIHDWIIISFWNSRSRPSAMLVFTVIDYWPICLCTVLIFHHYTKFGAKMIINARIMAQNRNSKWRPLPSWIYFRWLFNTMLTLHYRAQPPYKISCKCLNPRLN